MCQWPGCGRKANDAAHILNRTHRSIKWSEQNVVSLCRRHHNQGPQNVETPQGRVLMLALMRIRHQYKYDDEAYSDYWGVACELLELANYDEREVVRTWASSQ